MAFELMYTSAPQGLRPGTRGYCTVAMTHGLATNIVQPLEGLSGYRAFYPTEDPRAAQNPVCHAFTSFERGGQRYYVLSRICYAGLDYTQRLNKFAHHVVLTGSELAQVPDGPSWLAMQEGFFHQTWQGEPRLLPPGKALPLARRTPAPARTWETVAGDAGWAGFLAAFAMRDPKAACVLIVPPDKQAEVLHLFDEAYAVLPPQLRPQVEFSTYLTDPPSGPCHWRCVLPGSALLGGFRRNKMNFFLDLATPPGPVPEGELDDDGRRLVRQARSGEVVTQAPPPSTKRLVRVDAPSTPSPRPAALAPAPGVGATAKEELPVVPTAEREVGTASRRGLMAAAAAGLVCLIAAGIAGYVFLHDSSALARRERERERQRTENEAGSPSEPAPPEGAMSQKSHPGEPAKPQAPSEEDFTAKKARQQQRAGITTRLDQALRDAEQAKDDGAREKALQNANQLLKDLDELPADTDGERATAAKLTKELGEAQAKAATIRRTQEASAKTDEALESLEMALEGARKDLERFDTDHAGESLLKAEGHLQSAEQLCGLPAASEKQKERHSTGRRLYEELRKKLDSIKGVPCAKLLLKQGVSVKLGDNPGELELALGNAGAGASLDKEREKPRWKLTTSQKDADDKPYTIVFEIAVGNVVSVFSIGDARDGLPPDGLWDRCKGNLPPLVALQGAGAARTMVARIQLELYSREAARQARVADCQERLERAARELEAARKVGDATQKDLNTAQTALKDAEDTCKGAQAASLFWRGVRLEQEGQLRDKLRVFRQKQEYISLLRAAIERRPEFETCQLMCPEHVKAVKSAQDGVIRAEKEVGDAKDAFVKAKPKDLAGAEKRYNNALSERHSRQERLKEEERACQLPSLYSEGRLLSEEGLRRCLKNAETRIPSVESELAWRQWFGEQRKEIYDLEDKERKEKDEAKRGPISQKLKTKKEEVDQVCSKAETALDSANRTVKERNADLQVRTRKDQEARINVSKIQKDYDDAQSALNAARKDAAAAPAERY